LASEEVFNTGLRKGDLVCTAFSRWLPSWINGINATGRKDEPTGSSELFQKMIGLFLSSPSSVV
jgi:hypothetical protein